MAVARVDEALAGGVDTDGRERDRWLRVTEC